MRAIVYVPEQASRAKLDLLEPLGAEVRHAGVDVDEAKDAARAHAERERLPFFEDGAEPAQFDGYARDRRGDPSSSWGSGRRSRSCRSATARC